MVLRGVLRVCIIVHSMKGLDVLPPAWKVQVVLSETL